MENNKEVEEYQKALKQFIADQYPNLIGKSTKVLEIKEERIYFGMGIPFGSFSVSKEILNNYIWVNNTKS